MKKTVNLVWNNAEVYLEDGRYMIMETTKEEDLIYCLSDYLDMLPNKKVSITIKEVEDVASEG